MLKKLNITKGISFDLETMSQRLVLMWLNPKRRKSMSMAEASPVKCGNKVGPEKREGKPKNKALDDLTYGAIACDMKRNVVV